MRPVAYPVATQLPSGRWVAKVGKRGCRVHGMGSTRLKALEDLRRNVNIKSYFDPLRIPWYVIKDPEGASTGGGGFDTYMKRMTQVL